MRITLVAVLLLSPALAMSQSLGELAKKEKERRDKNKQKGVKVRVISENEIGLATPEASTDSESAAGSARSSAPPPPGRSRDDRRSSSEEEAMEEGIEHAVDVPDRIPPDLPLEDRIEMFTRMKRDYDSKVQEIDNSIAENDEQIRQLDAQIALVNDTGGAPVAPTMPSAEAITTPPTGQGARPLIDRKNRLQAMNLNSSENRKEQMKLDLQDERSRRRRSRGFSALLNRRARPTPGSRRRTTSVALTQRG